MPKKYTFYDEAKDGSMSDSFQDRRARQKPSDRSSSESFAYTEKSVTRMNHRERVLSSIPTQALIQLLLKEEQENIEARKLLDAARSQLDANIRKEEGVRLNEKLKELSVSKGVDEAARMRVELEMYKLKLEESERECRRMQAVVGSVQTQRLNAEEEAARSREKARRLAQDMVQFMAREEGLREGYKEGLMRGQVDMAKEKARNRPMKRITDRPVEEMSAFGDQRSILSPVTEKSRQGYSEAGQTLASPFEERAPPRRQSVAVTEEAPSVRQHKKKSASIDSYREERPSSHHQSVVTEELPARRAEKQSASIDNHNEGQPPPTERRTRQRHGSLDSANSQSRSIAALAPPVPVPPPNDRPSSSSSQQTPSAFPFPTQNGVDISMYVQEKARRERKAAKEARRDRTLSLPTQPPPPPQPQPSKVQPQPQPPQQPQPQPKPPQRPQPQPQTMPQPISMPQPPIASTSSNNLPYVPMPPPQLQPPPPPPPQPQPQTMPAPPVPPAPSSKLPYLPMPPPPILVTAPTQVRVRQRSSPSTRSTTSTNTGISQMDIVSFPTESASASGSGLRNGENGGGRRELSVIPEDASVRSNSRGMPTPSMTTPAPPSWAQGYYDKAESDTNEYVDSWRRSTSDDTQDGKQGSTRQRNMGSQLSPLTPGPLNPNLLQPPTSLMRSDSLSSTDTADIEITIVAPSRPDSVVEAPIAEEDANRFLSPNRMFVALPQQRQQPIYRGPSTSASNSNDVPTEPNTPTAVETQLPWGFVPQGVPDRRNTATPAPALSEPPNWVHEVRRTTSGSARPSFSYAQGPVVPQTKPVTSFYAPPSSRVGSSRNTPGDAPSRTGGPMSYSSRSARRDTMQSDSDSSKRSTTETLFIPPMRSDSDGPTSPVARNSTFTPHPQSQNTPYSRPPPYSSGDGDVATFARENEVPIPLPPPQPVYPTPPTYPAAHVPSGFSYPSPFGATAAAGMTPAARSTEMPPAGGTPARRPVNLYAGATPSTYSRPLAAAEAAESVSDPATMQNTRVNASLTARRYR